MKRYVLINEEAGTGKLQRLVNSCVKDLSDRFDFDVIPFQRVKQLESILRNIHEGTVFLVGGDGSLNGAVHVIVKHELPIILGIIPAGTVNDFATYLGISGRREIIMRYLAAERHIACDVGFANDRAFINVAAVGYIADVGFSVSRNDKRLFGRTAYYLKGVIDAVVRIYERKEYTLYIDGEPLTITALMVIVLNSGTLGGIAGFNPYASLTDGLLELYIIKDVSPLQGLRLFLDIMFGKHHQSPEIEYRTFKRLRIQSDYYMHMDLDGEEGCGLPAEIHVVEGALALMVLD